VGGRWTEDDALEIRIFQGVPRGSFYGYPDSPHRGLGSIPGKSRRICHSTEWGEFPKYQITFEHLGYRLPFTEFEVAVFYHLEFTPSQLHPNSLAFIRAFELVADYLHIAPTIGLFFHAFHLQRSKPKGDAANKSGWVSLKQSSHLFEMYEESVRGFKDRWFLVRPITLAGWRKILVRGKKLGPNEEVVMKADGTPEMVDYGRFSFHWKKHHYLQPASEFVYSW
jgi:hypothetical protein